MALNSRSEGSHCTYVTIQNVVDNLDKAFKNKHNAELQRTDPGTKVTGEFSTTSCERNFDDIDL